MVGMVCGQPNRIGDGCGPSNGVDVDRWTSSADDEYQYVLQEAPEQRSAVFRRVCIDVDAAMAVRKKYGRSSSFVVFCNAVVRHRGRPDAEFRVLRDQQELVVVTHSPIDCRDGHGWTCQRLSGVLVFRINQRNSRQNAGEKSSEDCSIHSWMSLICIHFTAEISPESGVTVASEVH